MPTTTPPGPVAPAPPPAAPENPLAWLSGAWHAAQLDTRWVTSAGATYGVSLTDTGFEVTIVRKQELVAYGTSGPGEKFSVTSALPNRLDATDAHRAIRFERGPSGLTAELTDPPNPSTVVALAPAKLVRVPEVEDAERAFAADSAARGAPAWSERLAPGGSIQQGEDRLTDAAAVAAAMKAELTGATLSWVPSTSGRRGDLAFTIGEWHFKAGTMRINGSFCTIWKRVGGKWLLLFDVGRPAS
ncbi:MAG TPA: DUF4440 domain-containing protein [Kofleriaceae bacterium]|jgi:hypothetical protein